MQGKLIVIEGLDGCGKTTQMELLKESFPACRFLTFPNYASPSGEVISQYLRGEFQPESAEISAYSASAFYAVDRYVSYQQDWSRDYLDGKNLLSARYTTSNAIYQMTKLEKSQWDSYCSWLYDFEYGKLGIPRPDLVIFLDVPVEISQQLLSARYHGDEQQKDIHESDIRYLHACRAAAEYASRHDKKTEWKTLPCCEAGRLRSVASIQTELAAWIAQTIT